MNIDIEQKVITADNENAGTVERLVVDPNNFEVQGFVIQTGALRKEDKLVDPSLVAGVENDVVRLTVPKAKLDDLPPFVRAEYFVPSPERFHAISSEGWAGSTEFTGMETEVRTEMPSSHLIHRSSFGEENVVLTEGAEVFDSAGEKLGSIDEVFTTEDGFVRGFIIESGFVFHEETVVPADWIQRIGSGRVDLRVTKEQFEAHKD